MLVCKVMGSVHGLMATFDPSRAPLQPAHDYAPCGSMKFRRYCHSHRGYNTHPRCLLNSLLCVKWHSNELPSLTRVGAYFIDLRYCWR